MSYRLNYLLLRTRDQEMMYRVSEHFSESLGNAFQAHAPEFQQIIKSYPNTKYAAATALRPRCRLALNGDGLDLTTELGYRLTPPHHANEDVYFVHSEELGAKLDLKGLYLDTETAPGSTMSFSTFGDAESRLQEFLHVRWPTVFKWTLLASNVHQGLWS